MRELRQDARASIRAEARAQRGIFGEPRDRTRKRACIGLRNEKSSFAVDDRIRQSVDRAANSGNSARRRFNHGEPETLAMTRQNEEIGSRHVSFGIRYETRAMNASFERSKRRPRTRDHLAFVWACEHEMHRRMRGCDPRESLSEFRNALVAIESSDEQRDEGIIGNTQLPTNRVARRAVGFEASRVDAAR